MSSKRFGVPGGREASQERASCPLTIMLLIASLAAGCTGSKYTINDPLGYRADETERARLEQENKQLRASLASGREKGPRTTTFMFLRGDMCLADESLNSMPPRKVVVVQGETSTEEAVPDFCLDRPKFVGGIVANAKAACRVSEVTGGKKITDNGGQEVQFSVTPDLHKKGLPKPDVDCLVSQVSAALARQASPCAQGVQAKRMNAEDDRQRLRVDFTP